MRPFLAELRRRNVYKVGVAYAVVAWIALQAASFLLPTFGAPAWVFRVLVLLVVLGFALAVAFSWAFELTPEGLKRTHEVPHEHSITHVTGRKLDFAIIGLLIVALGISVYLNLREAPRSQPLGFDCGAAVHEPQRRPRARDVRRWDPRRAADQPREHRLAQGDLAHLGDGVPRHDEEPAPDRQGTRRSATVLEGAVQRAGDNVRINVQLIDAATDEHLWANTYDRRLSTDNLFAIQTEIATTIADKLKATLTPDEKERIAKVPTENLQAYNLYLAGRQNLYQRKLEEPAAGPRALRAGDRARSEVRQGLLGFERHVEHPVRPILMLLSPTRCSRSRRACSTRRSRSTPKTPTSTLRSDSWPAPVGT